MQTMTVHRIGDRFADDLASPAAPLNVAKCGAVGQRRSETHDTPDMIAGKFLQQMQREHAAEAVADDMHRLAAKLADEFVQQARICRQAGADRRVSETLDRETVTTEPQTEQAHDHAVHPQPVD